MTNKLSDYELLKEIYAVVDRTESKLDIRLKEVEIYVDELKSWKDTIVGKITIMASICGGIASLMFAFLKDKLF